jgi:hypothetical protein
VEAADRARSHGVDERELSAASEDCGAEVGGAAVGGKAWLRVQDLVAAVLVGQVDLSPDAAPESSLTLARVAGS